MATFSIGSSLMEASVQTHKLPVSPQPRATFASELYPPGIPPQLVVIPRGLTLQLQPVLVVGIGNREIPRERPNPTPSRDLCGIFAENFGKGSSYVDC